MKKEIIGILVCMLMIVTALPVAGTVNINKDEVRTDLPNGFEIHFLGTKEIEEFDLPPEFVPPPYSIMIHFDNEKGEVDIECEFNISSKGGLLLRNRVDDTMEAGSFKCGSGPQAGAIFADTLIREGLAIGFAQTTISGEINGEDFSKTGILFIFIGKVFVIFGK